MALSNLKVKQTRHFQLKPRSEWDESKEFVVTEWSDGKYKFSPLGMRGKTEFICGPNRHPGESPDTHFSFTHPPFRSLGLGDFPFFSGIPTQRSTSMQNFRIQWRLEPIDHLLTDNRETRNEKWRTKDTVRLRASLRFAK